MASRYDYKANESKLRDSKGRRLTTGLFEELKPDDTVAPAVFKLADWKEVYIELCDPTGYKAAMELIGDWSHWQLLVSNPIFKEHLDEWNLEVETKIKSAAIEELKSQSTLATGTSAAKYLAEKGYAKKDKKAKVSLPEGEERAGSDVKRLGLKRVA